MPVLSRSLVPKKAIVLALALMGVPHASQAAMITRTIEKNGPVITIAGPAVAGDAKRFAAVVADNPPDPGTVVDIVGPGGMVYDGLRIGVIIHKLGWATRVSDAHACYSTCALIWLGGQRRVVSTDAHVAFHAPFDGRTHTVTEVGRGMMATYAKEIGLNAETVAFVMQKAPGEGFTWLDPIKAKAMDLPLEVVPSAKRPTGHFSTAAIDAVEGVAASARTGGADALAADIAKCYVTYTRSRDDAKGFQCFAMESAAIVIAARTAKADHGKVDSRLTTEAAVKRLSAALMSTGHSRRAMRALMQHWEADLRVTAAK